MRKKFLLLLLWLFLLTWLLPALVAAQGYDKERGRVQPQGEEKPPAVGLQLTTWGVGFGSFFDEESVTFSADALYAAVQFHGIGIPSLAEGTSTGIAFETHPAQMVTRNVSGNLQIRAFNEIDFRLWSITRVPMSAIPLKIFQSGTLARTFTGVDALIHEQGSHDFTGDFDARMVLGGDLGVLGPGNVVVEIYMFQRDVPIAFAIFYGI